MRKNVASVIVLLMPVLCGCASQDRGAAAAPSREIVVTNPIPLERVRETVVLDWNALRDSAAGLTRENAAILDVKSSRLEVIQFIEEGDSVQLLFQTDLAPHEKRTFKLMPKPADLEVPRSERTTYCRFIPERKDDFGWENDKTANRMYGPALEYETITSGIDAWGKCVPYPVIDKFIRAYNEEKIPYHYDHGEGGDFYKVGPTLGAGGMAPFVDGKIVLPRNFVEWKVLANGPIRSVFELTYKPWKAGPYTVSEVKRISIDLGSNLSRIECRYACEGAESLPLAAGIVLRETSDQTWTGDQSIAYWLPTDFIEGRMGVGVVFPQSAPVKTTTADGHLLLTLDQKPGVPVACYAGSCWDKNEEFNRFEKWQQYLKNFKQRIDNPVRVSVR